MSVDYKHTPGISRKIHEVDLVIKTKKLLRSICRMLCVFPQISTKPGNGNSDHIRKSKKQETDSCFLIDVKWLLS